MSLRDYLISVKSIQAIMDALAAKDLELLAEMHEAAEEMVRDNWGDDEDLDDEERQEFNEELAETKEKLRLFIASDTPPDAEPGCWLGVIERVIEREQLAVDLTLAFNKGYKHVYCWEPYTKLIGSRLTAEARLALGYLSNGRPFRGKTLDFDGCSYAWLTIDEITALRACLEQIAADEITDEGLSEFHADLSDALADMIEANCECVLAAS